MAGLFARWRRRSPPPKGPLLLSAERVIPFVDELEGETFARLVAPATQLRDQIADAVAGLRTVADGLAALSVKEATYGAPRATVQSSKDTLVRKFRSLSENFQPPTLERFTDLSALKTAAAQILAQAGDAAGTHARYLLVQFAPQVREMKGKLRQLQEAVAALDRLISAHRTEFDACSTLRTAATRIGKLLAERAAVAERLTMARDHLPELEAQDRTSQERLTQLLASPEYAAHHAQRQAGDALRAQLQQVQGRFESEFALLTKPLRKFGYVVGLDKNDRQLLDGYVEAAWRTFTRENGQRLPGLLAELAQAIGSQRVDVKEPAKTLQRIERWAREIPRYLAEHARLQEQLRGLETDAAGRIATRLDGLQREADDVKRRLGEERAESERLANEDGRLAQELDSANRAFESALSEGFGRAVRIAAPGEHAAEGPPTP